MAKNLIPSKQHLDEDEFIDLKAYSLDELKEKYLQERLKMQNSCIINGICSKIRSLKMM